MYILRILSLPTLDVVLLQYRDVVNVIEAKLATTTATFSYCSRAAEEHTLHTHHIHTHGKHAHGRASGHDAGKGHNA